MLSIIEVKCPHCGTLGQILVPPFGSIIVGPCPVCDELVMLFGTQVCPLDTQVILNGTRIQKRRHIMRALIKMLEQKVNDLIDESERADQDSKEASDNSIQLEQETANHCSSTPQRQRRKSDSDAEPSVRNPNAPRISPKEIEEFLKIDLGLIDKKKFFDTFFGDGA